MWRKHGSPWLLVVLLAAGCNQQDTEALTRIGKNVQGRAEALTGDAQASAFGGWSAVSDAGAASRVSSRLQWDKELTGTAIEVVPLGKGIELRGKVRNLEQRRRALMLADTTAGVEGVKDSLVENDK